MSSRRSRPARTAQARRALPLLALFALAFGGVDCAQERDPISRVQDSALPKRFFVGENYTSPDDDPEFYVNNYVVGASSDQTLMPVGTWDDVDRIRWEIQENLLVARKSYEFVTESAAGTRVSQRTDRGVIVAAYRIESQFDIRRAYNPGTGEELNVVEENISDRRWYDREYIRVDWSRNLVTNPDWAWVWYGSVFGDLSFSPVAWTEENSRHPDANNLSELNQGYFDITSRWLVRPENSMIFGEPLPTCLIANFFANGPVYSCNEQETTIRTSFRRVTDRDFEPLEMTRAPYDLVGGPRADRNGYDQGYGTTDANFHRYQMIHNVWEQSHLQRRMGTGPTQYVACTANTDANNNGTADQCETATMQGYSAEQVSGSQCDMVMAKCTMPYRQRRVRPIAYYVNPEMPPQFQNHVVEAGARRLPTATDAASAIVRGPSEEIIDTWNVAIMRAVADAREVECRRTGGNRDACHAQFYDSGERAQEMGAFLGPQPKASNGPAVVLCHNPVMPSDPKPACRDNGYRARLGDIRYNHMTYIPGRNRAPFGGITHWGYDPLTGEVISNGGLTMGRSAEFAAAQQRDFVLMMIGDLEVSDYVEGAASQSFARTLRNPASAAPEALTSAQIAARARAIDTANLATSTGARAPAAREASAALEHHERLLSTTRPVSADSTRAAQRFRALSSQLQNTSLEADMIDEHWLSNLGFDPSAARNAAFLDQVSPLRRMDPDTAEGARGQLQQRLEMHGFCFQDVGAPPVVGSQDMRGVARWFQERYGSLSREERARRIYDDLLTESYKGIQLHEIGHSLGLYHMPPSSYDSMNYNPQYWQLRTRAGQAQGTCLPTCTQNSCNSTRNADRNNDNCMGPRYLDPPSDEELGVAPAGAAHAGINYFGNTSTMEYQWERFGETVGLGAYDVYAMGILYGRVIETMEPDTARGGFAPADQQRFSARLRSQLSELDQIDWTDPVLNESGVLPIHYTELARQMRIFDPSRCRPATAQERERYRWRIVDGQLCSFAPRDHAAMTDFESTPTSATSERVAPMWRTRPDARTGGEVLRWGYRVGWDIATGYPHINYFDQGADPYEVTQSMIEKYRLTYPSLYFRRGQREFGRTSIPYFLARTIFRRLRGYHWSVARDTAYYSQAFSSALYERLTRDDNWLRPWLMAAPEIFDFFAGVLLRPEPGQYELVTNRPLPMETRPLFDVPDNSNAEPQFEIGIVDGRFIGEEYDNTAGGSWDYHSYVRRAGAYPEKPLAAIMLTDTRPTFSSISRSLFLDGREFQLNFRNDMPRAYDRLLGGLLSEDWDAVAMHVPPAPRIDADGNLTALAPQLMPLWTNPTRTDPYGEPLRPAGSRVLFPNIGYRQELPTVVYSMLFSSLNSDLTTIQKLRIWTEGGPEAVDVPEADRVRFRNPETGVVYVARRYERDRVDGVETDRGIASRMLAHANLLLRDTYQVELDGNGQPVRASDGSYRVVFDPTTREPVPANRDYQRNAEAVTRFHNYVGLIDATRYAARLLGYGTLN
jgi:hypothetical protein